jgi:hypothetical protein
MCKWYSKIVSVINGKVSSSTLVEVTSLPWLRTPQENDEQPWKWKKSFTKRKYLKIKLLKYTTRCTKLNLSTDFLLYTTLFSPPPTRRHGYGFYRRKLGLEMTPLPSSRVPLLLETTKNTKPACSAAKIRGRTAFWLLIGPSGALCKSSFWEISIDRLLFISIDFRQNFDRSNFKFDRSTFQDLRISSHFLMKFAIPLLLSYGNRKHKN